VRFLWKLGGRGKRGGFCGMGFRNRDRFRGGRSFFFGVWGQVSYLSLT
jgi:hypothetical protein